MLSLPWPRLNVTVWVPQFLSLSSKRPYRRGDLQLLVRPRCRPDAVDGRCRGRTRGGGRLSSAPAEADAGEHVGERRHLRCSVLLLRVQPSTEPDKEHLVVELHHSETKAQVRLQPEAVF